MEWMCFFIYVCVHAYIYTYVYRFYIYIYAHIYCRKVCPYVASCAYTLQELPAPVSPVPVKALESPVLRQALGMTKSQSGPCFGDPKGHGVDRQDPRNPSEAPMVVQLLRRPSIVPTRAQGSPGSHEKDLSTLVPKKKYGIFKSKDRGSVLKNRVPCVCI